MREYEFVYIVQPDAEPERVDEIHARVETAIEGGQGKILLRDDWGKRKLAYEIQKFQKGHYFLVELLGDGKFITELERGLRLDPDVLRFLTILVTPEVADVPARLERATKEAAERAERRAERERLDQERQERERLETAARAEAEEVRVAAAEAQAAASAAAAAAAEAEAAAEVTEPGEPAESAAPAEPAKQAEPGEQGSDATPETEEPSDA